MKKQDCMIFTYRYIWKNKDRKFCVKFISGSEEEHKSFISKLTASEEVVTATRIYINEVNVNLIEQHEFIKKEKR